MALIRQRKGAQKIFLFVFMEKIYNVLTLELRNKQNFARSIDKLKISFKNWAFDLVYDDNTVLHISSS